MLPGTVFGVGVGPGDPELVTIKAANVLAQARVVAYFAKRGKTGNAFAAAERYLHPESERLPLVYPYTVELAAQHPRYVAALEAFYSDSARLIAEHVVAGRDVAVLCEGDPLFYGSYLHLHVRLAPEHRCVVIPGVTSFAGCAARAGIPLVWTDRVFSIVPGTLSEAELEARLRTGDPTAIIKLGRNFGKVKAVLERVGRAQRATYFERGTTSSERIVPLPEQHGDTAIYFSLILVPAADGSLQARPAERLLSVECDHALEGRPYAER
ncbi:MAG TPA: precorrin-2 C(20)-methyltransferase [Polyangiaceae bacterium]|nr:precorrin-2 C(20)-methyltransferase [Polyangiaceae bacterium]